MSNQPNLNDSAILFLGTGESSAINNNPQNPSSSSQSSLVNPNYYDGHQILDQVQKELQFLPTQDSYVSGTMMSGTSGGVGGTTTKTSTLRSDPFGSTGNVIIGGMSPMNNDTDFLVETDPISLANSPNGNDDRSPYDDVGAGPSSIYPKYSIWQFAYYAQYFNLSTDIFVRRLIWSLLPLTGGNKGTYVERHIQSNPDLYGPVWISLTLSFIISICNDIIKYLNQTPSGGSLLPASSSLHHLVSRAAINSSSLLISNNNNLTSHFDPNLFHNVSTNYSSSSTIVPSMVPTTVPPSPHYHHLQFRFDRLHLATTLTLTYVILVPTILWSFCQWRRCTKLFSFLECLCSYGYSLSAFIPVVILSTIVNIREIQFILFVSAAFMSGSVLLISFAPVVHSDPSKSFKFAYLMLILMLFAHFILALLYLYLFL